MTLDMKGFNLPQEKMCLLIESNIASAKKYFLFSILRF